MIVDRARKTESREAPRLVWIGALAATVGNCAQQNAEGNRPLSPDGYRFGEASFDRIGGGCRVCAGSPDLREPG